MGGKIKKSTRKFNQKHLKGALQVRRNKQISKKRAGEREAKLEQQVARAEEAERRKKENQKAIDAMNMDDFLSGGFEGLKGLDLPSEEEDEEELSEGEEFGGADSDSDAEEDEGADVELPELGQNEEDQSESDDEDEDESDEDGEGAGKKKGSFKDQLAALATKDPEFYKYMQETDRQLLEFSGSEDEEDEGEEDEDEGSEGEEDDEEGSEGEEDEDEEEEAGKPISKSRRKVLELTSSAVETWTKAALEQKSLKALTQLCKAFRVAVHYGEVADQDDGSSFAIASSSAFNKLMVTMLQKADGMFRGFLDLGNKAKYSVQELKTKPRWKKVEPLLKSYLGNAVHALSQVTDASLVAFILRRLRPSATFLAPFGKVQRRLLKAALNIFGMGEDQPRIQALLLVREMALVLPGAHENCLKGAVKTFLSVAKFHSAQNQGQLDFMAQSVVELANINPTAAYAVAFAFVRQLAIVMRNALTNKTKDAYKEVYNWQFVHSLELWARVVVNLRHSEDLKQLTYPLSQLLQGAARLVPTPRYFPLRLRCCRVLNQLAAATGLFIPVAAILLEVFQFSGLKQAPKGIAPAQSGGSKAGMNFDLVLRVPKNVLRTTTFQDELINQVMELLADHMATYAYDVSYPELSHLPLLRLRFFARNSPVERFRRQAKMLVTAAEKNQIFVGAKRDRAEFSPKDLEKATHWMDEERKKNASPLFQYNQTLQARAKARLEALRAAEVQLGEEEGGKGRGRKDEVEEDDDDEMLGGANDRLHDEDLDDEDGFEDDEEEEDEDEEEDPEERPAKKGKGSAAALKGSLRMDIDDDALEDLVVSDDDEEAPRPAKRSAPAGDRDSKKKPFKKEFKKDFKGKGGPGHVGKGAAQHGHGHKGGKPQGKPQHAGKKRPHDGGAKGGGGKKFKKH